MVVTVLTNYLSLLTDIMTYRVILKSTSILKYILLLQPKSAQRTNHAINLEDISHSIKKKKNENLLFTLARLLVWLRILKRKIVV